jgi:hypothetical protein
MSINTSGTWWTSPDPEDIGELLEATSIDHCDPIDEFALSRCNCGSIEFQLETDGYEGFAKRTCSACGKGHYICNSEEVLNSVTPEIWTCVKCNKDICNVGVGFVLYPGGRDIGCIYIGCRCPECEILGYIVSWKVDEGDTEHLMMEA